MVDIFREGKSEQFALTETKLKGNGEVSFCGVNGIFACVKDNGKGKRDKDREREGS